MTFNEYYIYYLSLHQNRWCRRLHLFGNFTTIFFVWAVFYFSLNLLFLFLTPFVIYPFAWSGHFFFERNKPAAWNNPLWAKMCDWIMMKDIIVGRIEF